MEKIRAGSVRLAVRPSETEKALAELRKEYDCFEARLDELNLRYQNWSSTMRKLYGDPFGDEDLKKREEGGEEDGKERSE